MKQIPLDACYALKGLRTLMGDRMNLTPELVLQLLAMLVLRNPSFAFLKQFWHAHMPSKACYQAVVEADLKIQQLRKVDLLPGSYALTINDDESHPWVKEYGLPRSSFGDLSGFLLDMNFELQPGKVIRGG